MKTKTRHLIIIMIIFVGVPLAIFFFIYDGVKGNPIRSLLMENATKEHLLKSGYSPDDWLEVEGVYEKFSNTNMTNGTVAYVVFKDEPEEKYKYIQLRKTGEIKQSCEYVNKDTHAIEVEYTEKRKHMVKDCY